MIDSEVAQTLLEVERGWVERGRLVIADCTHLALEWIDCEDLGIQSCGQRGVDHRRIAGVDVQVTGHHDETRLIATVSCPM